jgi:flavodoxin
MDYMKTAIIYYSKTGHTKEVCERMHREVDADLFSIKARSDSPDQDLVELIDPPRVEGYDRLVIAAPVHGFSLARIMRVYLKGIDDFKGTRIDLFVTQFFPFAKLGAKQALQLMRRMIEKRGGIVSSQTAISWSKKREKSIDDLVNRIQRSYRIRENEKI